jgi:hypothetical protein
MDHLSPAGCRWYNCLATQESALYARLLWLFLAGIVAGGIAAGFIFLGKHSGPRLMAVLS